MGAPTSPDTGTQRTALPQTLVGAGTLVVATLLAWGALSIPADAGYAGVGPNFLPWVIAALLGLCGAFLIWESLSGGLRDLGEPEGAEQGDWLSFAWVSAGILLVAALISTLGFVLSCALCFVLAVRGFRRSEGLVDGGVRTWLADAGVGLAIAAPVYWMFTKGLAISLPGLTQTGWL